MCIRDSHCTDGLEIYDIKDGNEMIEGLTERLTGRFLVEDLIDEKMCIRDSACTAHQ